MGLTERDIEQFNKGQRCGIRTGLVYALNTQAPCATLQKLYNEYRRLIYPTITTVDSGLIEHTYMRLIDAGVSGANGCGNQDAGCANLADTEDGIYCLPCLDGGTPTGAYTCDNCHAFQPTTIPVCDNCGLDNTDLI